MRPLILCAGMVLPLCAWPACTGAATEEISQIGSGLVYGSDTRVEADTYPDDRFRRLASETTVALIPRSMLTLGSDEAILNAPTLSQSYAFCEPPPFADQPVAAQCSGVLVDSDLVLTAAHCVDSQQECNAFYFVFGYSATANGPARIDASRVYECGSLVSRELAQLQDGKTIDHALIRLDRAVRDATPALVRGTPAAPREHVFLVGNGLGLPTKIDDAGVVGDPRAASLDYFTAAFDLFHGGSGSPVFDGQGSLLGLGARGGVDLDSDGRCVWLRNARGGTAFGEQASYAASALIRSGFSHLIAPPEHSATSESCSFVAQSNRSAAPSLAWLILGAFVRRRIKSNATSVA